MFDTIIRHPSAVYCSVCVIDSLFSVSLEKSLELCELLAWVLAQSCKNIAEVGWEREEEEMVFNTPCPTFNSAVQLLTFKSFRT